MCRRTRSTSHQTRGRRAQPCHLPVEAVLPVERGGRVEHDEAQGPVRGRVARSVEQVMRHTLENRKELRRRTGPEDVDVVQGFLHFGRNWRLSGAPTTAGAVSRSSSRRRRRRWSGDVLLHYLCQARRGEAAIIIDVHDCCFLASQVSRQGEYRGEMAEKRRFAH